MLKEENEKERKKAADVHPGLKKKLEARSYGFVCCCCNGEQNERKEFMQKIRKKTGLDGNMDESVTHAYRTFLLVEDLDMKISLIIDDFQRVL